MNRAREEAKERYETKREKKSKSQADEQVSRTRERQHEQSDNDGSNFEEQKTRPRVSASSQCCRTKLSVNQSSKQSTEQSNQIKNQTSQQKKKFTHLLRIRKPPLNAKTPPVSPFLKQNGTCTLASTPLAPPVPAISHFGFEGGVGTTTPHVLKKINQPKNNKTIPTTAFPPIVFPFYIATKTEK
jgi:hypothetical protein